MSPQSTLFPNPPAPSVEDHPLVRATLDNVEQLEAAGGLADPAGMARAQLAVALARSFAQATISGAKPYSLSNLADSLNAALSAMPATAPAGDQWETWVSLLDGLATTADDDTRRPAYATPPTPGAPHETAAVEAVAALLGTPLMPWQRHAARIITERTPDGRRWRWPLVVITVPRQSGKTTLLRCLLVQRCITRPATSAWLTAQTGKDATARWHDIVQAVAHSPLAPYTKTRRAAGTAGLTFTRNDTSIKPFPPTADSLHGYTLSDAVIDEAFAFDEAQGADLLGAIMPAMATIEDSQLIIVSTAGSEDSLWLKDYINKGRQAISEKNSILAYIEWSSKSDGDWYSSQALQFHPAIGHTITEESIKQAAAGMPINEWRRAYLNQWVETAGEPLANPTLWFDTDDLEIPTPIPGKPISLVYEVAYDRSRACLAAAWLDQTGQPCTRIIADQPGVAWLPAAIHETLDTLGPDAILAADDGGPTRQITEQLAKEATPVKIAGGRDYTSACAGLLAHLQDHTIRHHGPDDIPAQLTVAASRPIGDGWAISRRHSAGNVHQLIATAIAVHTVDNTIELPAPRIII